MGVLLQPVIPLFVSCRAASQHTSKAAPNGRGGGGSAAVLSQGFINNLPQQIEQVSQRKQSVSYHSGEDKGGKGRQGEVYYYLGYIESSLLYSTVHSVLVKMYCAGNNVELNVIRY